MRSMHFKQFYIGLLVVASLFAFVIPSRASDRVRANLQTLFWPIARPAHLVGIQWDHRLSPAKPYDDGSTEPALPRDSSELLAENAAMRVQIANLTGRIAQLEALDRVLASVGDIRALCERFSVVGASGDGSPRDLLHITASSMQDVALRMPVLYGDAAGGAGATGGGIAGIVDRVEIGGATVKLVTDKSFACNVGFARFIAKSDGSVEFVLIAAPRVLARGDGDGRMYITNLSWQQAKEAELRVGDWVILDDDDWPAALQRYRVGRIESIEAASRSAGYPRITVIPGTKLMDLRDVLVMVRK